MIRNALFLASRHLRATPARAAVMVGGVMVALFLPFLTWITGNSVERALLQRAEASPILIGARGNEFDLTMSSLYFRGSVADEVGMAEVDRASAYGVAVPLLVAHSASGVPLVGTSTEYFEERRLRVESGRLPAILGEIVAGAGVAARSGVGPGDTLRSDLSNLYNLAGAYPLALDVVGVLAATGAPDDDALFADIRTTWVLEGLLHGHAEVTQESAEEDDEAEQQGSDRENLEASAAIFLFDDVDDRNLASFHMHGDEAVAPVSSVLVFPSDSRRHDQLLGDYALDERLQAVRPTAVVGTVLGLVLRARTVLDAYFVLVASATAAFFGLVVILDLRLRSDEIALMRRIGSSRATIAAITGAEILVLLASASAIAGLASWLLLTWIRAQLGL